MKKMLTALSVFLTGLALAQVESQVVGYQNVNLNANAFKMMGVQFGNTSDGSSIKLNDMFTGVIPYGSQIQVLKPSGSGYDQYTYIEEAYPEGSDDPIPGWADRRDDLVNVDMPLGTSFWLKVPTSATLSIAGAVSTELSVDKTILPNTFAMIAGAYPVDISLNDLTWNGLSEGDTIQIRNPEGTAYILYTYIGEAYPEDGDPIPGWADRRDDLVTTPISAGTGFWIKTQNETVVSYPSPLL